MQWIELTVITTTEAADIVANALEDCGSYGASVKDPADLEAMQRPEGFWDMIDESVYADFGDTVRVTGFFRQDASLGDSISNVKTKLNWLKSLDLGGIDLGTLEVTMGELNEQDWANNWRKYYKPTRVGNDFIIKPTWEEYEKKENDLIIHMDPGMAFGT
ncbi:MAG: 50S ribosomal protein L11 methyltransferase, partial [Clostridia bacterium]|nr:50S ribosomal protein L11 methyltransferase [Clostridia bacterium]